MSDQLLNIDTEGKITCFNLTQIAHSKVTKEQFKEQYASHYETYNAHYQDAFLNGAWEKIQEALHPAPVRQDNEEEETY